MIYTATVDKIEDTGDEVEITTTNVRRRKAAGWRSYAKGITFRVPHGLARKTFYVGRPVLIKITPNGK